MDALIESTAYLCGLSEISEQNFLAEYITDRDEMYVEAFYSRRVAGIIRKIDMSNNYPFVLVRNGVVMASRGLDNVTDVLVAMRQDLARRNGGR